MRIALLQKIEGLWDELVFERDNLTPDQVDYLKKDASPIKNAPPLPPLAKPFYPKPLPGIDERLVQYRIEEDGNKSALFNTALQFSFHQDQSAKGDSQVADRIIKDFLRSYQMPLAWVEAEVAVELHIPHEEIFEAVDLILNPTYVIRNLMRPQDFDGPTAHYSQRVIDRYLQKVEDFAPELGFMLRAQNTFGPEHVSREALRFLGVYTSHQAARDFGRAQLPLRYDLNVDIDGQRWRLLNMIEKKELGTSERRAIEITYENVVAAVDQAIIQLAKEPHTNLKTAIQGELVRHRRELLSELADFLPRTRETLKVYESYYHDEIARRSNQDGAPLGQLNEMVTRISRLASLIPDADIFEPTPDTAVPVEKPCQPLLLPAPTESIDFKLPDFEPVPVRDEQKRAL